MCILGCCNRPVADRVARVLPPPHRPRPPSRAPSPRLQAALRQGTALLCRSAPSPRAPPCSVQGYLAHEEAHPAFALACLAASGVAADFTAVGSPKLLGRRFFRPPRGDHNHSNSSHRRSARELQGRPLVPRDTARNYQPMTRRAPPARRRSADRSCPLPQKREGEKPTFTSAVRFRVRSACHL